MMVSEMRTFEVQQVDYKDRFRVFNALGEQIQGVDLIKKILHIGIPSGLENSMFQLGKILVLSLVASFGTSAIAANAVSSNLCNFEILPGITIGFAIVTVV